MEKEDVLFPFEKIRDVQEELISKIKDSVDNKQNLVVHAPTGLGKTIASIGPALKKAEDEGLTVFFLTSRHTQHSIAVETLKDIKNKYDLKIPLIDIVGKKWMCLQDNVDSLSAGDFSDFCKTLKEGDKCEYYTNIKDGNKRSLSAKKAIEEIDKKSPLGVKDLIDICDENEVCPHEISLMMAKSAKVVIADYYYIFSPTIRDSFLKRSEIELEKSIIIVDEGHNLPDRIRDLLTKRISTRTISQARKEAKELGREDCIPILDNIQEKILDIIDKDEERLVKKEEFHVDNKDEVIELFDQLSEKTIENSKRSYLKQIANFLEEYSEKEGFINIITHITGKYERIELKHECLDPSEISQEIFENSYSSIIMSGTLTPVKMYKDLLGMEGDEAEFTSPFSEKNKLNLIVPKTTTKYSERSEEQYRKISENLTQVCNSIPGNCVVFFPSYFIRDKVYELIKYECEKTIFNESRELTKESREELLSKFKSYSKTGAVLLGVTSGSFGEGIDLPGEFLKGVVIVGLPLSRPDLKTKSLIDYYDKKYSKGWEYGYILPAITKAFQNAGRCIRSENDSGVIVFMDRRYTWGTYKKGFSEDVRVSANPEEDIRNFFNSS